MKNELTMQIPFSKSSGLMARFVRALGAIAVISSLLFTSCVENSGGGSRLSSRGVANNAPTGGDGDQNAGPSDGSVSDDGDEEFENGVVELRHVVDPFDGTYKTKATIPKNFTGLLYLSGLNVSSLKGSLVKVRFKFGRELAPITVPASIGRAPGITPKTNTEVLIMDFQGRPFENLRLHYDLFDYNDYTDSSGNEVGEPTQDPRDGGLYCRGLRVEDDPTFQGNSTNSSCDEKGEKCLYTYAKVLDSGLAKVIDNGSDPDTFNYVEPTKPQIDDEGSGYSNLSKSDVLTRCLPDSSDKSFLENILNDSLPLSGSDLEYGASVFGGEYEYHGPYRATATSLWEIRGDAVFSEVDSDTPPTGIFQKKLDDGTSSGVSALQRGYDSFKFPRAGTLDLRTDVEHFGSPEAFSDSRPLTSLLSAGESDFMGGCNIRAAHQDEFFNETVSSCNVTAKIEILKRDVGEDSDELVTSSSDVKIQLIRASQTDFQGEEVLYTSLKTCSSSSACGIDECCFNNRCWSDEIVSQCVEDTDIMGNLGIGETCQSDFECSTLCCNPSVGTCQPHTITEDETTFCSKSPGQSCVSKEFCQKENVTQCFVVKTGIDPTGSQQCALRCYNVPTHGDCKNGVCRPPETPDVPEFDEDDPDCSEAIDPPTDLEPISS